MATQIRGSVGSYESGAANNADDIRTVQSLLTAAAKNLRNTNFDPKGIDGKIARSGSQSGTVKAIANFQTQQVRMGRADNRIDVNGKTWQKLVGAAGNAAPVAPRPTPQPATGLITLTVSHGGNIPTVTKFKNTTPATVSGLYESSFVLSGSMSGTFTGSIYPDDMTVKGRVVDGTYPLHIGFHKGGGGAKQTASDLVARDQGVRAGLLVNARNGVSVQSDNAGKTLSHGINVHNGFRQKRYSDGCLTLHPDHWARFIQMFLDAYPNIDDWHTIGNNTGKRIGSLVIRS